MFERRILIDGEIFFRRFLKILENLADFVLDFESDPLKATETDTKIKATTILEGEVYIGVVYGNEYVFLLSHCDMTDNVFDSEVEVEV